jgi:hypothetical protein
MSKSKGKASARFTVWASSIRRVVSRGVSILFMPVLGSHLPTRGT